MSLRVGCSQGLLTRVMNNPYLYPSVRHRRTLAPGPFPRYQQYKPALQQEFGRVCVYCRTPDGSRGVDVFGVEHYRPKRKFPELATVYANLFYVCNTCNRRKGDFWPSQEDQAAGRFVPNPCDHVMFQHVRFQGIDVSARTVAGRWLVDTLQLNNRVAKQHRTIVLASIKQLVRDLRETDELIAELSEAVANATGARRAELTAALEEQEVAALEYRESLSSLGVRE